MLANLFDFKTVQIGNYAFLARSVISASDLCTFAPRTRHSSSISCGQSSNPDQILGLGHLDGWMAVSIYWIEARRGREQERAGLFL